jgi:uracil-DNA glycosylase
MLLQKLWDLYEREIFPAPSTDSLFNQYRDDDPDLDLPAAHVIRRENLKTYLGSFSKRPTVLVVGESGGEWASHFSGVPFTSERQLVKGELPFAGRQSSRDDPGVRAGKKPPYAAGSPTVFWRTMAAYYPRFIGWEWVPCYPHLAGNVLKKRSPTDEEIAALLPAARKAVEIIAPEHIVAVGEKASSALDRIGVEFVTVHHTAHDVRGEFASGMKAFFAKL